MSVELISQQCSATGFNRRLLGDCRDGMRQLIAEGVRVQMCVTSPPYWQLRDYGIDGQFGLEPTLTDWLETMVDVFSLVRDLLADDGTLWLQMGDRYREKQLVGQSWKLAFALQDDGWYLRQDIIWHKPNPMPESVTDRFTKANEYLFLLSKKPSYFFDQDSIREPVNGGAHARRSIYKTPDGWDPRMGAGGHGNYHAEGREKGRPLPPKSALAGDADSGAYSDGKSTRMGRGAGWRVKNNPSTSEAFCDVLDSRNRRNVWTIPSEPFSGAHFATFPKALIEPCILAGSQPGDIVLDPFMGSGTTAQVAQALGRRWLGCEINPDYLQLQHQRTAQSALQL